MSSSPASRSEDGPGPGEPGDPPGFLEPPAEPIAADGHLQRLDPGHVPCSRLGGAIFSAVLALAGGIAFAYVALATDTSRAALISSAILGSLVLALVALSAWLYPPLEYRHAAWRLSPFGLEIRRGVWFRHSLSVPRARVQHADVERGPLERRFDLATLVVHTAGHQNSEIRLEGLRHATALAIRESLLAREERAAHEEDDGA